MPQLNRCHVAALNHGYRIGLELGDNGAVALGCRDIDGEKQTIVVLGADLEYVATILFAKLLQEQYIPRSVTQGGE
jgi:hypothetical protein